MAAREPTDPKNRKHLTPEQKEDAYSRYVFSGESLTDIARALGVHRLTVRAEWQRERWEDDRIAKLAQSVNRRKAHGLRMAQRKEEIEVECADLALTRIRAQRKVADELLTMATDHTAPVLGTRGSQGLATALGPAAPDIEKARLSVGLTTEKTETTDSDAEILAAVLSRVCKPPEPDGGPGNPGTPAPQSPG